MKTLAEYPFDPKTQVHTIPMPERAKLIAVRNGTGGKGVLVAVVDPTQRQEDLRRVRVYQGGDRIDHLDRCRYVGSLGKHHVFEELGV